MHCTSVTVASSLARGRLQHYPQLIGQVDRQAAHLDKVQCIWKVLRPLDFFYILLRYSLILKLIKKIFSPSSIYTQYPIMAKQKQVFTHFSPETPLLMTPTNALSTYSWVSG